MIGKLEYNFSVNLSLDQVTDLFYMIKESPDLTTSGGLICVLIVVKRSVNLKNYINI